MEQQSREVWAKLHEEERERKREYWAKKNAERNARQAEMEKKQEDDRLKAEAERQAERKEAEEARNNFVWCIKPDETYQDYVKRYQKYLELKKK